MSADERADEGTSDETGTAASHATSMRSPVADDPNVLDDPRACESVELSIVPPAIERDEVEAAGRVGCVAYPYRIYDASVSMSRPLMDDREDSFVVSVDRSRRLAVRADTFPDLESRHVDDALVLPAELTPEDADERARKSVFQWTLRRYSPDRAPEIEFERVVEGYKLFWLAERDDGDVIVDSLTGSERSLDG
ncbi:hypothetical protein Halru_2217 [Halovivax ruber XH-70]|uniref:Uncharacterized protein n=1 Tax=Halovivax ruber (strain DSM 18193 / JCM 13892 / XH-70) TaxID=797302 RepID=L0IDI5_HALRX|nr:hypothetical protein [Halovivax ruber]AGB16804.1 hypothetical protein Halru_2217 [Halovivax ruber XH-70]